ncbi:nitrate reductase [Candidatus Enterovibrio escicola]|uniref:Assimilatory nitrate reductase large subunit n=1 Tax=Candidatus Enterovibrio escicola TaxID=1927127 RepID=A0A2A5T434_9GAMM|nr:nitrate reductase [Candidatus Enterovibrio escacola]PCS22916.1 Assimilatory nitrate reductase large subunit [Candidatus Enterovibrio escacola]
MPNTKRNTSKDNKGWIKTTCPYCGVGCGIEAKVLTSGKLDIRGDKEHPANYGRLCSKGLALAETILRKGRLLTPSIQDEECSWDDALTNVATSLNDVINKHGPDAVAFYVSGQLLTEDYYVVNKLMKGFIGSANIDTNSRLCMASAVAGHKRAFGEDCVPGNYQDLELANLVVLVGSNLAWCHPVLYQRLKIAKIQGGTKVVVIDPRRTSTCEIADLHLPLFPGTDIAIFTGLLAYLSQHNHVNHSYVEQHTSNFDTALKYSQRFSTISSVSSVTGLRSSDIEMFYQWFCENPKTVTLFSQGVNQSTSGTDKVNSIINCHLATGRIGRVGSSPFSITGQPNAMGGREVGGLANTLAAHLEFGNEDHIALLKDVWQTNKLATKPGLKAIDMFDAIDSGKIKALWIMATNPAVSLPDSKKINTLLANCPFLIVSDCVSCTDTMQHAHVRLPAQGWSEKSGTVTNSERTISRQRRIMPTPGEGKPDWWIVCEVAKRMGFKEAFDYQSEADIFSEYAKLTAAGNTKDKCTERKLNLAAIQTMTTKDYQAFSPKQWPLINNEISSERLFSDGHFSTPDGKARFVAIDHRFSTPCTTSPFTLLLNSGRNRDQWHTMTQTGLSASLSAHAAEPVVDINPFDATTRGIKNNKLVMITSNTGKQIFKAHLSNDVMVGQCFAPIHWSKTNCSSGKVNSLIPTKTDLISGQPAFKTTPVAIEPLMISSVATLITPKGLNDKQLKTICADYWVKQTIKGGYFYRFLFKESSKNVYSHLILMLEHSGSSLIQGHGSTGWRGIIYCQTTPCLAFSISSIERERIQPDIVQLLTSGFREQDIHTFLSGCLVAISPIICTCKQVKLETIEQAIIKDNLINVEDVVVATSAGTGCGSCIAELVQIISHVCERDIEQEDAN